MPGRPLNAQQSEPRSASNQADVIVYGSTPGGFCAAIAAAREGASVILLEPTDHVGAMSTGGLSHCDSNQMVRSTLMGLFDEWHTRVVKDYTDRGLPAPYDPAKKDQSTWTFEPHVAMRVTMQMLDEAGVTVLTGRYLKSVTKDGPRITSLVTTKGTFHASVFVDGTYEGDLMAAAGVDWTIGREGREEYGESLAGKQYPKSKLSINGFDNEGRLLPLITTNDAGDKEVGDIAAKSVPGIVLDDAQAKLSGTWSRSTNFKPYIEDGYIFCGEDDPKSKGDGNTTATFRFQVPKSGQYQVLMAYSAHATRSKNVPLMVSSGADKKTFAVDQTKPLPSGKQFRPVATVDFRSDVETVIQVTNADTTGFVILDALQLLPVE